MEFNNLSNGSSNGIAMVYVRDGKLYPVMLTEQQATTLDISLGAILTPQLYVNFKNEIETNNKIINLADKNNY